MFGDMPDWAILLGVATAVSGCILFVMNQVGNLRKDIGEDIGDLRKEFITDCNGIRKEITRVDDDNTRKVQVAHDRINTVEKDTDYVEKTTTDRILGLKDQLIEVYKNK
jgi:hypothetical protein